MQAFARVHRTGQKQQTHLTLLYSNGNPAEQSIITRQQIYSKALEMTWNVTTGEIEAVQRRAEISAMQKQEKHYNA
jgi:hypothetical protein